MREIMLAEIRHQDIRAEVARYRLASQAQPVQPAASVGTSLMLRVVRACGRTLAARLAISTHSFGLGGDEQEQTALSAAH
jgi:hypothetical protein